MGYLNMTFHGEPSMAKLREVKRLVAGHATTDGAGVALVRILGQRDVVDFDPFLMLDAFDSADPRDYVAGFPWHPHRGIETVTYLVEGNIEHGDSLGNSGVIRDGDCQWMTAGSGIIHQEMPKPARRMWGAQLWLNLPAKDKFAPPAYGDIVSANVPQVAGEGNLTRVISGEFGGVAGAFQGRYLKPVYLDVRIEAGREFQAPVDPENTVFAYIMQGSVEFGSPGSGLLRDKQAVLMDDGDQVRAVAGDGGARFLLLSGRPLNEPVAWGGPIVMNTQAELEQAFAELDNGTFIRHPA